ncbi:hypothetical protein LCGC14_2040850, partial [marine sediment metagenome]
MKLIILFEGVVEDFFQLQGAAHGKGRV